MGERGGRQGGARTHRGQTGCRGWEGGDRRAQAEMNPESGVSFRPLAAGGGKRRGRATLRVRKGDIRRRGALCG